MAKGKRGNVAADPVQENGPPSAGFPPARPWRVRSKFCYGASVTGRRQTLANNPGIAALSMGFALSMGLLGGVLPAARAARLNIVDALRAA